MQYLPFEFPGIPDVHCAFTTRLGGQSRGNYSSANISFSVGDDPLRVQANRLTIMQDLQMFNWLELTQIHGPDICFYQKKVEATRQLQDKGDALATDIAGQALIIKVADCQPVLLAHASGSMIAAMHVGWRANRARSIQKWVREICRKFLVKAEDLSAVRGPSLGPDKSEFINFDQEWGQKYLPYYQKETHSVDLWQLTQDQLLQAGLLEQNIFRLDLCTYTLENLFFSYRRNNKCGRQAAIIWMG